jgi:hypothetical protein
MNKKLALISIILIVVLGGCSLIPEFRDAQEQYLQTRVADLLTQTAAAATVPTATEIVAEATATEETIVATEEPTAEVTEEVTEEATEEATAEPTAEPTEEATAEATAEEKTISLDPAKYLGDAAWSDDMTTVGNWPTSTDEYLAVTYDNGKLMFKALTDKSFGIRCAPTKALENAYIETTFKVNTCATTDSYGLYFRVPENVDYNRGYIFNVTCDGRYSLQNWDRLTGQYGTMKAIKDKTSSSLINSGSNQTNRLGVMAIGDKLVLYINGVKVDEVIDSSYSSGYFGVFIKREKTENLTVYVDDVKYWANPTEK